MKYPNFSEERKLWRKGYRFVIGLDEAGRGPLAGSVIAAAVMINSKLKTQNSKPQLKVQNLLKEIKDSKKLSPKKREELFKILINHPQIQWGIGKVSEKVIDKINILEATKLAMKRAIKNLEKKWRRTVLRYFLILDGSFKISVNIPQKSIIRADEKVMSCAAASILAKVTRDRIMKREHKKYPQYGFAQNKGYGTKKHLNALQKYGPSVIHRTTFGPVQFYLS